VRAGACNRGCRTTDGHCSLKQVFDGSMYTHISAFLVGCFSFPLKQQNCPSPFAINQQHGIMRLKCTSSKLSVSFCVKKGMEMQEMRDTRQGGGKAEE